MPSTKLSTINVESEVREAFGSFVYARKGKLRGELASEATLALQEYMEKHRNGHASKR